MGKGKGSEKSSRKKDAIVTDESKKKVNNKYKRRIFKGQNARTLLSRRGALVAGEKTMNALDLISRIFITEFAMKAERLAVANRVKTIKADHALLTVNKRMNMNLVSYEPKVKAKKKKEE